MTATQQIGRWCYGVPGCSCGMPTPTTLAPPAQVAARDALVRWLRACPVVEERPQTAPCRFAACAWRPLVAHDHGDGAWRWAATIPHYVEAHGLKIPDALFDRAVAAGFVAPARDDVLAAQGPPSDAAWRAFAVEHGAAPRPLARRGFGSQGGFLADGTRFITWQGEQIVVTAAVEEELAAHAVASTLSWTLQDLTDKLARRLRPVGYWAERREHSLAWLPWPHDLVAAPADGAAGADDRADDFADVVDHLSRGAEVQQWLGHSRCRFDGCTSGGSVDRSDGVFVWPHDYGHYIAVHRVRPPRDLVAHVRRA